MKTIHNFSKVALSVSVVLVALSCGKKKQPETTAEQPKSRVQTVQDAAREFSIPEKVLLTTAYTQSNFGLNAETTKTQLKDSDRNSILSLTGEDAKKEEKQDLNSQVRLLSEKVKKLRESSGNPRDNFDWLALTAKAIVGVTESDKVTAASVRVALLEQIRLFNSGFTIVLPNNELLQVPPAPKGERIEESALNAGQKKIYLDYQSSKDWTDATNFPGDVTARAGSKDGVKMPKIVLRWCPGSALQCFDYLRKTKTTPSHFLSIPSFSGSRELIQFHPLEKDLKWYEGISENVISITISGLAGMTPEAYLPDWIDWEDYVKLRNTIRDMLDTYPSPSVLTDAAVIREHVLVKAPKEVTSDLPGSEPTVAEKSFETTPEGFPDFAMPVFWDAAMFDELLVRPTPPRDVSIIATESPKAGQIFEGPEVNFILYPGNETRAVQVFQDQEDPTFGNSWDLIDKDKFDPRRRTREFPKTFTSPGATRGRARAVKIVARDEANNLLGSRIIRFVVKSISETK